MSNHGRGLFLDLDGTLADSLSVMRTVFDGFLEQFGHHGTDQEFDRLNGPPLGQIVRDLKGKYGLPGSAQELTAVYNGLIDRAYARVRPVAGAVSLIAEARKHGWIAGVVTSNSRARTEIWLDAVGLSGRIDVIVGSEDITEGKPSPQPYLLAVSRAACRAEMSIGVDDSMDGVRAALSAGLETYGYETGGTQRRWPTGVHGLPRLADLGPRLATRGQMASERAR